MNFRRMDRERHKVDRDRQQEIDLAKMQELIKEAVAISERYPRDSKFAVRQYLPKYNNDSYVLSTPSFDGDVVRRDNLGRPTPRRRNIVRERRHPHLQMPEPQVIPITDSVREALFGDTVTPDRVMPPSRGRTSDPGMNFRNVQPSGTNPASEISLREAERVQELSFDIGSLYPNVMVSGAQSAAEMAAVRRYNDNDVRSTSDLNQTIREAIQAIPPTVPTPDDPNHRPVGLGAFEDNEEDSFWDNLNDEPEATFEMVDEDGTTVEYNPDNDPFWEAPF